jgi:flavin reductase (DIM6/NTAB) family NADH-FMN oxidoreductase RutF
MDTHALRKVLGCYATGVAVITARTAAGEHIGVTVNSFSSVSLEPPLILFSLSRSANVLAGFQQTERFAVNILRQGQQTLSNTFSRPSTASWASTDFKTASTGCVLFTDSLAQLECTKIEELKGGDHVIFLCEVTRFHMGTPADPLLFFGGAYGTYTRDRWNRMPPTDGSLSEFAVTGWG